MVAITLKALLEEVGSTYKFDNTAYPGYEALPVHMRAAFRLKHSILHITKPLGKLSREAEHGDHGEAVSDPELDLATAKLLIAVLNLAHKRGITADRLATMVRDELFRT